MHLPRWTVYPALALLAVMLIVALPRAQDDLYRGTASSARSSGNANRQAILPDQQAAGAGSSEGNSGSWIYAVNYLPEGFPRDGSKDATAYLQTALDAALGNCLVLPSFPVLVSRAKGQKYCLKVPGPMQIQGTPGSLLIEASGSVQVLRAERIDGLILRGFSVRGVGTAGHSLAHGLVQVTYGSHVLIDDLRIEGADADGIAIAGVNDARVINCTVTNTAKSAIYLSDCDGGVVRGNLVEDFGGHTASTGQSAGAGIQLSSNREVLCSDNLIRNGQGMGILCNAGRGRPLPWANTIRDNRISAVSNEANPNLSSGIHCANSHHDKNTNTLVAGNSIQRCGLYGIYMSMHSGSNVVGNTISESERSGIVISACTDINLRENNIRNSDISQLGGQAGIYLLNGSSGVHARGNHIKNSKMYANARGRAGIIDRGARGANDLQDE